MAFRSTFSPNFDCLVRSGNQGIAVGDNTLAAWFKWDNTSADYEMVEINDSGGATFASAIQLVGGDIVFHQTQGDGSRITIVGPTYSAGVWTHAAITWDGTTMTGYVDGASVGTQTGLGGARGNWSDLQIGPGVGELQDAVFYTVALTPEQIAQLYRNRMPGVRTGLRHHLPCFPGATNRLIDYSGNALNFSNNGTPAAATSVPQAGWGTSSPRSLYSESSATPKPADAGGDTLFGGDTIAAGVSKFAAAGGDMLFGGAAAAGVTKFAAAGGDTLFAGAAAAIVIKFASAGGDTLFGGSAAATVTKFAAAGGDTLFAGAAAATGGSTPPSGAGGRRVKYWRTPRRGR
jgi:hypothetical protein